MPCGMRATMLAKIISEMPLPTPRWVISSPSHITSTVPAVSVITISIIEPKLKFRSTLWLFEERLLKRNT